MITLEKLRTRHAQEERDLLVDALENHGWNISAAAQGLGVPYSTLHNLIGRLGLDGQLRRLGLPPGRPKSLQSL